jgi:cobalt-zinc-cadmium efflux system protein
VPAKRDHLTAAPSSNVRAADRRYLAIALGLIATFMVFEVVAGIVADSLALLADAGHMLTDVGALGLSIWAIRLAAHPTTAKWTFGLKRAEILSAAVNGVALVVVSMVILAESVQRLLHPAAVHGAAMIVVASVGVAVNLVATLVVARANRRQLNVAGAFAHLVTDLWAFIGTLVAGVVILETGFDRADPIASLLVVVLMLRAAWTLLRDSGHVLLEAAPAAVDLDVVRAHLLATDFVRDVHDLHAWVVTSDLPALSAHVVLEEDCFLDGRTPRILDELQMCLAGHFDIEHSTFQLESPAHADHERGSH